jgi:ribosome maturation factor RimP
MPPATSRQELVRAILDPAVSALGFDLEDVQISQAGRRSVIRVIVDTDGGIDLDAVAQASRAISAALDEAELSGAAPDTGPYVLEVSSPGVDRPLTAPRHWRRNIGRLVAVTASGAAITGRVTDVDDNGVSLDVRGRARVVPFAALGPGKVQVEFGRIDEADLGDDSDLDDDDLDDDDLDAEDVDADDVDAEDVDAEDDVEGDGPAETPEES